MSEIPSVEQLQKILPSDLAPILDGAIIVSADNSHQVSLIRPVTPDQLKRIVNLFISRGYKTTSIRPVGVTTSDEEIGVVGGDAIDSDSNRDEALAAEGENAEAPDQLMESLADAPGDGSDSVEEPRRKTNLEIDAEHRLDEARGREAQLQEALREQRFSNRLADLEVRRLERAVRQLETRIEGIERSRESLEDWVLRRRDSFAWRFASKLGQERAKAESDARSASARLESGRQRLNQLLVPVSRKPRFAAKAVTGVLATILIVYIIQLLASDTGFFGDLRIPNPLAMSGFAALLFLGGFLALWLNSERAKASQTLQKNHEARTEANDLGLDMGQHALMLITLARNILVPVPLIVALVLLVEYLATVANPAVVRLIPTSLWLWLIALGLWLIAVLGAWWNYYQELSRLRGLMLRVVHEAKWEQGRYLHAEKERVRLEAMHAMVPEFLELLARVMHQPWRVDTSLVDSHQSMPPIAVFPASVALARASRGRGGASSKLIHHAFASAYQPGWLMESFRELLDESNEREGSLENVIDLEAIYADPGDSLNGARKRALAGICNEEVRKAVGRERLPQLADAIQRFGIRTIRPPVKPLRDSGLGELQISSTRFKSETADLEPWDEFLMRALSPAAPFSLLTFDPMKLSHRPTRIHRSHVLGPRDLVENVPKDQIDIIAQEDEAGSPLDWVVRIDRSDWMDPSLLRIFSGSVGAEFEDVRAEPQQNVQRVIPEG